MKNILKPKIIGFIREPQGIDLIIQSDSLTENEKKEISQFIADYKANKKQPESKKMASKTRKATFIKVRTHKHKFLMYKNGRSAFCSFTTIKFMQVDIDTALNPFQYQLANRCSTFLTNRSNKTNFSFKIQKINYFCIYMDTYMNDCYRKNI